jgi:hypothetical protein
MSLHMASTATRSSCLARVSALHKYHGNRSLHRGGGSFGYLMAASMCSYGDTWSKYAGVVLVGGFLVRFYQLDYHNRVVDKLAMVKSELEDTPDESVQEVISRNGPMLEECEPSNDPLW